MIIKDSDLDKHINELGHAIIGRTPQTFHCSCGVKMNRRTQQIEIDVLRGQFEHLADEPEAES